jgi:hypothetical protein
VFKQSLSSLPGVLSSVYSASVPGGDYTSSYSEMENAKGETQKTNLNVYFVDYDYINQYKLKLVAGRNFSKDFICIYHGKSFRSRSLFYPHSCKGMLAVRCSSCLSIFLSVNHFLTTKLPKMMVSMLISQISNLFFGHFSKKGMYEIWV